MRRRLRTLDALLNAAERLFAQSPRGLDGLAAQALPDVSHEIPFQNLVRSDDSARRWCQSGGCAARTVTSAVSAPAVTRTVITPGPVGRTTASARPSNVVCRSSTKDSSVHGLALPKPC